MALQRVRAMGIWAPNYYTDEFLSNNFQLETFVSYFWPRYHSQTEAHQRRLIQWLLSKTNGKGSRHEQNLKLDLEPVLAFLVKSGNDPTYTDENGQTILHVFFSIYVQKEFPRDDEQMTMNLMDFGASIIAADHDGNTPLGMAVEKNRFDIIQILPPYLRNINERNILGETALHIIMQSYVKQGHINSKDKWQLERIIANFVAKGANVNIADINGITPVHYAAMKFYLSILKTLKDRRADLYSKTKNGDNLLILACKNITMVDDNSIVPPTIEWLLNQGYDVNYRNRGGHTALHYAVQCGNKDVVAQLIGRGADVNVIGLDGATPLHSAVMSSYLKNTNKSFVVVYLLEQGIKADAQEKVFGFGIEHLAAFNRGKTIIFRKRYVNKPSKSGLTPLHLAAMSANTDAVTNLIELGANVHCREKTHGYTPLHLASMRGQFRSLEDINVAAFERLDMNEPNLISHCFNRLSFRICAKTDYQPVIERLLKAGADINCKDSLGRTPLHCAIHHSDAIVVEQLLKAGAHVDSVDKEGHAPLQKAILVANDNWQVIECLLKHGADIDDIEDSIKDIYEQSKIYKFTIADRLLRYVAKLECVNLRSTKFYIPPHKQPRIDNFKPKYKKEIQFMKKRTIKDHVSLYDVLFMTSKQRATFVDILPCDLELQVSFADYGTIICGRCYEAVNRESMLESAKLACNWMMQVQCPDLCIDHIFSFLRNRDLRALLDACVCYE